MISKIFSLRNYVMKQIMKPNKEGIMQIPNQEVIRDLSNEILTKFIKYNVPKEAIKC